MGNTLKSHFEFLDDIVKDRELETIWLDLLSQMEYVGCRKILASVPYERVNLSVLQHVAEEASHAFALKKLVLERASDRKDWVPNPLSELAWTYFQSLDQEVSAKGKGTCPYPLVSWIVERRVLWLYPVYAQKTQDPEIKSVLGAILAQEARHGAEFAQADIPRKYREMAKQIEAGLWREFEDAVRGFLSTERRSTQPEPASMPLI